MLRYPVRERLECHRSSDTDMDTTFSSRIARLNLENLSLIMRTHSYLRVDVGSGTSISYVISASCSVGVNGHNIRVSLYLLTWKLYRTYKILHVAIHFLQFLHQ